MLIARVEDLNRRREPRFRPCLEEVLWRPEGETRRSLRGCLRDVSERGLSLLTAGRPAPGVGGELQVHLLGSAECAFYRIMWVERGERLAAVGCRRVERAPQPLPRRRPAPRLLVAVPCPQEDAD